METQKYRDVWLLDKELDDCVERAKGFEPSAPTLARLCSTPELRPQWVSDAKVTIVHETAMMVAVIQASIFFH